MAKSIVAAGLCKRALVQLSLCKRALVQLSYAIGVAKPLSLFVEIYGTEKEGLTAAAVTDIVKLEFDCRPGALAREPKYNRTAAYCHFGREAVEEDGKLFFSWEKPVDLSNYASMDAAAVAKTVAESQEEILKKWVD
jgi:S-adenosylmethionine synthetase